MAASTTLTRLLRDLKAVSSPLERMRVAARAWRSLRRLRPEERQILATQVGLEGAEEILEGLGRGEKRLAPVLVLRALEPGDAETLQQAFDETYTRYYGRTIPDMDVEVLTWALTLTGPVEAPSPVAEPVAVGTAPPADGERTLFNTRAADFETVPVYGRDTLTPGTRIAGPAIVSESQTTTVVTSDFDARIDGRGYIILERRDGTAA